MNEARMTLAIAETPGVEWLQGALGLARGQRPFPWQLELLRRFLRGDATEAIDIPTGLGKTAVMARRPRVRR
jgi:CRISPR/Cas system-associated endonuclease/helicase Cas3